MMNSIFYHWIKAGALLLCHSILEKKKGKGLLPCSFLGTLEK